jgi:hypothetical protein
MKTKLIIKKCPLCKKEIYSTYQTQLDYNFDQHRVYCLKKHNLLKTDKAFVEKTKHVGFPR